MRRALFVTGLSVLVGILIGRFLEPKAVEIHAPRIASPSRERSQPTARETDSLAILYDANACEFDQLMALALDSGNANPGRASFAEQFEKLSQISDWTIRAAARDVLFRRWIADDSRAAFDYLKRERGDFLEFVLLWTKLDKDTAVSAIRRLPDGNELKSSSISKALREIAKKDPAEAMDLMKSFEAHDPQIFAELASKDVEAALAAVEELSKTRQQRKDALHGILLKWAKEDVAGAILFASNQEQDGDHLIRQAINSYATIDPEAAITLAFDHLEGAVQADAVHRTILNWLRKEPENALKFAESWGNQKNRRRIMGDLARQLASDGKPDLAVRALKDDYMREIHTASVFGAWARKDWNAAATTALDIDDRSMRLKALEGLLNALPSTKLRSEENLNEWVTKMIDAAAADGAVRLDNIGRSLRLLRPETLKQLVSTHGTLVQNSLPVSLGELADRNPEAAIDIINVMEDSLGRDNAAVKIASVWAKNDPTAAAQWADTLPDGEARQMAIRGVVNHWSRTDPAGAEEWLGQMEQSPARVAAIGEFVAVQAGRDPEGAVALARSIGEGDARNDALSKALTHWAKIDPEAATNAIASNDLSESTIASITQSIEKELALRQIAASPPDDE